MNKMSISSKYYHVFAKLNICINLLGIMNCRKLLRSETISLQKRLNYNYTGIYIYIFKCHFLQWFKIKIIFMWIILDFLNNNIQLIMYILYV